MDAEARGEEGADVGFKVVIGGGRARWVGDTVHGGGRGRRG